MSENEIFRALADPTRRAVFEQLTLGEAAVKDLTAHFHVSQPAISQHLAVLRVSGMVLERREGRHVYYRVDPAGLRPLVKWIERYQGFWFERFRGLKALLEEVDR